MNEEIDRRRCDDFIFFPHPGKNIQGELHPPDQTSSSQLKPTIQIREG